MTFDVESEIFQSSNNALAVSIRVALHGLSCSLLAKVVMPGEGRQKILSRISITDKFDERYDELWITAYVYLWSRTRGPFPDHMRPTPCQNDKFVSTN